LVSFDTQGVIRNASDESRFEEEVRARFPNKLDESVLDPVRLLFSLCTSTIPAAVTSDSSNGTTSQQDDHSSFDTLNSTGITGSKEQEHSFPWKLHTLLEEAEREGFTNIVSWVLEGTAFKVHDSDAFVNRIMPNFFDQSKCKSRENSRIIGSGILTSPRRWLRLITRRKLSSTVESLWIHAYYAWGEQGIHFSSMFRKE